jgi:hypothetical protein
MLAPMVTGQLVTLTLTDGMQAKGQAVARGPRASRLRPDAVSFGASPGSSNVQTSGGARKDFDENAIASDRSKIICRMRSLLRGAPISTPAIERH